jgi:hypothetical protein
MIVWISVFLVLVVVLTLRIVKVHRLSKRGRFTIAEMDAAENEGSGVLAIGPPKYRGVLPWLVRGVYKNYTTFTRTALNRIGQEARGYGLRLRV